jgi:hypothetical protein
VVVTGIALRRARVEHQLKIPPSDRLSSKISPTRWNSVHANTPIKHKMPAPWRPVTRVRLSSTTPVRNVKKMALQPPPSCLLNDAVSQGRGGGTSAQLKPNDAARSAQLAAPLVCPRGADRQQRDCERAAAEVLKRTAMASLPDTSWCRFSSAYQDLKLYGRT